jgi:uncharacterized membrane protein YuzA (DUF378 family)
MFHLKDLSMKTVQLIALVLVIVGAVNWGLVGVAQFDLVAALFGGVDSPLSRVVYTLVGASGLVLAATTAMVPSPHGVLRTTRA